MVTGSTSIGSPGMKTSPGMLRDIANGRPYRRHVATKKTMDDLYDRLHDSRFYKSFKWVYYANNVNTLPAWESLSYDGTVYFNPSFKRTGYRPAEIPAWRYSYLLYDGKDRIRIEQQ